MASGAANGGMFPKVEACARAWARGCGRAHILDGRTPHALLLESSPTKGWGRWSGPTDAGSTPSRPEGGCRSRRPLRPHAQLRRAAGDLRAGRGSALFDIDGQSYLDFLSGLAVTSLGHAHPALADAVADQARTLSHVSNLFGNRSAPRSPSPSTG